MDSITRIVSDFRNFTSENPMYLICSFVYYLASVTFLFFQWWAFFLVAIIYIISMGIAFSSIGEWLMRTFNHTRRLETAQEKNFLRPLFREVYNKAKAANPELGQISLFVIDNMTVNACAMGRHTIAVTKGAISTFSEDELKAILCHEIAHILHYDTAATLYALVGNGIFMLLILPLKLLASSMRDTRFGQVVNGIFGALVAVFMFLMNIAMALDSREAERRADEYALKLGYGEEMVQALYLLEKINLGSESSLIKRLIASHPRLTARIERLEIKLGVQVEEE